jgi:hypothetical protein
MAAEAVGWSYRKFLEKILGAARTLEKLRETRGENLEVF